MISKDLLDILSCPDDGSRLTLAEIDLVENLNAAIAAGKLTCRGGTLQQESLDGALVREAGDLVYPIRDGIPSLLVDDGIFLEQLENSEP